MEKCKQKQTSTTKKKKTKLKIYQERKRKCVQKHIQTQLHSLNMVNDLTNNK